MRCQGINVDIENKFISFRARPLGITGGWGGGGGEYKFSVQEFFGIFGKSYPLRLFLMVCPVFTKLHYCRPLGSLTISFVSELSS